MTSLSTKAIIFYNLKDVNNVNYKIMKRRSASAKSILKSNGFTEVHNGGGWSSLQNKIR